MAAVAEYEPQQRLRRTEPKLPQSSDLTDKQREFVRRYATLGELPRNAAHGAGYAHPEVRAYELLGKPHIQRAIAAARDATLSQAATRGASYILAIIEDNSAAPELRFRAAKFAISLERAPAKAIEDQSASAKSIENMSVDELEAHLEQIKRQAADKAKPIIEAHAQAVDNTD